MHPATAAKPLEKVTVSRNHTLPVLFLALILRLLVLLSVLRNHPAGWLYTRGIEMGLLAKSLLAGEGLSSPFGSPTGPTAFIAPGYPILIAGVFRIFGVASLASEIVIIAFQILANLVTIWLIMHLARTLFNQRAGLFAGLIWSCSLPLLWIPTIFWDTALSIALITGFFALVLHYEHSVTRWIWLSLGIYGGGAALINPALILAFAAMLVWLAWQQRAASRGDLLLAVVAFAIAFAPWPIRNARVFHAFIPLRTTVGFELWMGNHAGSSGYLQEDLFPMFNQKELDDYKQKGEVAYTANKSKLAMEYIQQHPIRFLQLTAVRVVRFWLGSGTKGGSALFTIYASLNSLFGIAGFCILLKKHRYAMGALFALPLLLFPVPYYITHAEFRYRLILDPLLTILAASAMSEFPRSERWRRDLQPVLDIQRSGQEAIRAHSAASYLLKLFDRVQGAPTGE